MKNDSAPKRSILKRIAPLIMSVMMVFVMMPSMAYFVPEQASQSVVFAEDYTVTFYLDGDTVYTSVTVEGGKKVTKPDAPTKDGYTFNEWVTSDGTKWQFNKNTVESDLSLYATWTANSSDEDEDLSQAAQGWITQFNGEDAANFYSTSAMVDEVATDYYEISDALAFDEEGNVTITYYVSGQQKWLPATLRKNNGTALTSYTVEVTDNVPTYTITPASSITFSDTRGNSRIVTIGGLESGKNYQLYWRKNGTSEDGAEKSNPQRNVVLTFKAVEAITPTVTLDNTSYTYDGTVKTPSVTVKDGDTVLTEDTDYTVSYADGRTNAGEYAVDVTLKGNYSGTGSASFTINKAANPLTVKAKTATLKYKKLKKKAQTLAVTKVIKFTKKGQGTMTYTLSSAKKGSKSFKKYFKINKSTGKVTVKKKLKKGTYKVKVKVKAAGNSNYNASAVKTVTFKVKVK